MKILLTILFFLVAGCAQYELVPANNSINQVDKDMQDYACSKYRGVKRYTEAPYVPCNVRNVWVEWENVK